VTVGAGATVWDVATGKVVATLSDLHADKASFRLDNVRILAVDRGTGTVRSRPR
jgi:hypothetical protein